MHKQYIHIQDSGKACLLTYIIYVFKVLHNYIGLGLKSPSRWSMDKKLTSALLLLLVYNEIYSNRRGEYHKYPVSVRGIHNNKQKQ